VLHHHERYDGQGFPDGIEGESISVEARILAVANKFDNVVGDSDLSEHYSAALEELKNAAGTQLDPQLVELFAKDIESSLKFMT
jgi:HD-GYP domain-containing protein (c-di-GMP phosphodiesterase class II)